MIIFWTNQTAKNVLRSKNHSENQAARKSIMKIVPTSKAQIKRSN